MRFLSLYNAVFRSNVTIEDKILLHVKLYIPHQLSYLVKTEVNYERLCLV